MSTNPGELRIYNVKFERPIPRAGNDCLDFHDYLRSQITGYRQLLNFEVIEVDDCAAKLRFWCNSTGRRGINALREDIMINFPDVDIVEFNRE